MTREGDICAHIKAACDPADFDFSRAEGRADFDDALRSRIVSIEDDTLRRHVAEMIRQWRAELWARRIAPRPKDDDEEIGF